MTTLKFSKYMKNKQFFNKHEKILKPHILFLGKKDVQSNGKVVWSRKHCT